MIKLSCTLSDKKGQLIPSGTVETLSCIVFDEHATFRFKDDATTRRFCLLFRALEVEEFGEERTVYNESIKQFITKYPGLKEAALVEKLKKDFQQLGGHLR